MSFQVPLIKLENSQKKFIRDECTIKEKETPYKSSPKTIYTYDVNKRNKTVILPLYLWKYFFPNFPILPHKHRPILDTTFIGNLIQNSIKDQKIVVRDALNILKDSHSCLLALRTGFGKSILSIYLILKLGFKTAIICHYRALHVQWKEYINKFSNLKVRLINSKYSDPDELLKCDADVYIIGAKKASLMDFSFFSDIGTVIVDEVESICTTTFSEALHRFFPKYLIGCSATPDRSDGLDKILYNYFGPRSSFIFRTGTKNFTVIKCSTRFRPQVQRNFKGNLDWVHFVTSLSENEERQKYICELITSKPYKEARILLFISRIAEMKSICEYLKARGESVDYISTNKKNWDTNARILIGTYKKIGVGYSIEDRSVTIFAGDIRDVRQPEGRVRIENNIILDIVDSHPILEKHWIERKKWYLQRGANINNLEKDEEEYHDNEACEYLLPIEN